VRVKVALIAEVTLSLKYKSNSEIITLPLVLSPANENVEESIAALISEAIDKPSRKETTNKTVYCLPRAKNTRKVRVTLEYVSHKPSPQHRRTSISINETTPLVKNVIQMRCARLDLQGSLY
jgi:hypothetical protein